jgi:hypothetical protein
MRDMKQISDEEMIYKTKLGLMDDENSTDEENYYACDLIQRIASQIGKGKTTRRQRETVCVELLKAFRSGRFDLVTRNGEILVVDTFDGSIKVTFGKKAE